MATATLLTETRHAEGFIVSEVPGGRLSRDQGTLASGQTITAGTVLGVVLGTTATATALRTNTGNGTFSAITVEAPAVVGNYLLTMEAATEFTVTDPQGEAVGNGTTGTAFEEGGLGFTLTAGATAFVAGDAFSIAVTGQYTTYDPTLANGAEVAVAIALNDTDASAGAVNIGVLARMAEINSSELVWGANVTTTIQQTQALQSLAAHHIVARSGEGVATFP